MNNTDRKLNKQTPLNELEHFPPVPDSELEAVAFMSIEDVDLELRQMGLDPDEPLPRRIAWLVSESEGTSDSQQPEEIEADCVPIGGLVKGGDRDFSAALYYCQDNYLSVLDKCHRAMRARGFPNYHSDGEDLAQTVCERLARITDQEWEKIEKREHYLSTVIRHEADRAYREKKDSLVINLEDPSLHIPPHFDRLEAALELREVLDALPEDRRQLVEMAYLDGMTNKELATLLNLTPETVCKRLSRIRRMVKDLLLQPDANPETSSSQHECADEVENHESAINSTAPGINLDGEWLLEEFKEFISTLPEKRRRAIILRLENYPDKGCSFEEIAKRLNGEGIKCTHVTVRLWVKESIKAFFDDSRVSLSKKAASFKVRRA